MQPDLFRGYKSDQPPMPCLQIKCNWLICLQRFVYIDEIGEGCLLTYINNILVSERLVRLVVLGVLQQHLVHVRAGVLVQLANIAVTSSFGWKTGFFFLLPCSDKTHLSSCSIIT